jgi:hypothetical protein
MVALDDDTAIQEVTRHPSSLPAILIHRIGGSGGVRAVAMLLLNLLPDTFKLLGTFDEFRIRIIGIGSRGLPTMGVGLSHFR